MAGYVVEGIGWLGSFFLILAYFMISSKRLSAEQLKYQLLNLLGAFFLLVYAFYHLAYPFVVVNSIWVMIGFNFIYKNSKSKQKG